MIPYDLIRKKQSGLAHSDDEIEYLIQGYTAGSIPDYQMAAWLMAVYFQGLDLQETAALVSAMIQSGESLDLSDISGPRIDKHSTGGVGDKVSLVLAPLVASLGIRVPMISGRGLGHTGGTLDKLESIPGFSTDLTANQFKQYVSDTGLCIMSQSDSLVPADKKMYALRDVTATVRSIPLICGSIMSKKIAEGIDGLVLDVKTGSGAFMSDPEDARTLAQQLVRTGNEHNVRCRAVLTSMDQPLGRAVGNRNEVVEAVQCLQGEGPDDVMDVTRALAVQMLLLGEIADSENEAAEMVNQSIANGSAYEKFREFVRNQGGNPDHIPEDTSDTGCEHTRSVTAAESGYVAEIDSYAIGMAGVEIGAGRRSMHDQIDHSAGIQIIKKVGDRVEKHERLAELFTNRKEVLDSAANRIQQAYTIKGQQVNPPPLIHEIIS